YALIVCLKQKSIQWDFHLLTVYCFPYIHVKTFRSHAHPYSTYKNEFNTLFSFFLSTACSYFHFTLIGCITWDHRTNDFKGGMHYVIFLCMEMDTLETVAHYYFNSFFHCKFIMGESK